MNDVRVRFAPSPTGSLHIGGVRTALYSWLWARRHGGTFILRIEDTDAARSTEEATRVVLDSMRWLGLSWDEGPEVGGGHGPYFQSQRIDLYREHAERLISEGKAYRCYCSKEDLAAAREAHKKSGVKTAFRYPGTCRDRTDEPDLPWVVRFNAPSAGVTGWDDLVKGRIDVANETQQDFVILRQNGLPLYSYGCVIDDGLMGVTLAARGDDHVINTAPQILMYEALGWKPPAFAHVPLILAPDGSKLSKRHAAVGVLDYRDIGYLPDGLLNYLARVGWSHGDQEIFTREELVEKFSWDAVGKTGGRYDVKKLAHVQAEHLRQLPDAKLAALAAPFFDAELGVSDDDPRLLAAMKYVKPRATTLADVAQAADYFFRDPPQLDEKAQRKFLRPQAAPGLRDLAAMIKDVEPFTVEPLSERVMGWLEERGLTMKQVAQPARVSLTGRSASPGLFEVMEVLGRDLTLARLARGADLAEGPAGG